MKYIQEDKGLYLVTDASLVHKMLYQAECDYPNETGGMLAGYYSKDRHTVYVKVSVTPSEKSSSHRTYERKIAGMEGVWAELEKDGLRYIGEWHSHPDGSTNYSHTDFVSMADIEKEVSIQNPIMLIVGARKTDTSAHTFYCYNDNKLLPYKPMIDLKDLFAGLQKQMLASLNVDRAVISHPGSKGDAVEKHWIDFLVDYLPDRYKVDKAIVIDSEGNVSEQMDIVVYDSLYTPFIFNQDGFKYIPAESVYAVFEVKQDINGNIEYASKKIASVRRLKRTSIKMISSGNLMPARMLTKIVGGILTTMNSYKERETIENNLKSLQGYGTIDMGCCCDYGSFFVDYEEKPAPKKGAVDFSNNEVNRKCLEEIYESRKAKSIQFSSKESSLFTFFLQLVNYLKIIGTVPAIDINAYLRPLNEKIDEDI